MQLLLHILSFFKTKQTLFYVDQVEDHPLKIIISNEMNILALIFLP